ncbi:unnamed protein product [Linum tenue]|uniref:Uncharacterized protein n=1 Tax=Linum tenue TaxID=586396 RepID=A0AAV0I9N3_9ROSI|nr:unnamed protein product [Linum tenue]
MATADEEIREVDEMSSETTPLIEADGNPKSAGTPVPEAEIHLYRQGKGPIEVFKMKLGGWEQDQLEVRDILDKHGFKCVYAFNPGSMTRGTPIRFNRKNGRSMLAYKHGAVIYLDGEPQDSMIKPVTKILFGVAIITLFITVLVKEPPQWIKNSRIFEGNFNPWLLALGVIVFTRIRKRTKDFLGNRSQ